MPEASNRVFSEAFKNPRLVFSTALRKLSPLYFRAGAVLHVSCSYSATGSHLGRDDPKPVAIMPLIQTSLLPQSEKVEGRRKPRCTCTLCGGFLLPVCYTDGNELQAAQGAYE